MKIDRKLLAGILSELPENSSLADYLADSLATAQETADHLDKLHAELKAEEEKYKANKRQIEKEICEVQRGCRHWSLTRTSDPTGSTHQETQCDVCGLRL